MTVTQVWTVDEQLLMNVMAECNDSKLNGSGEAIGDPTETALMIMY